MRGAGCLSTPCKSMLIAAVILLSFEPLAAQAQGVSAWNAPCLKAFRKWKTLARHKAFAVSNSNAGAGNGQACAYTWAAPSKSAAETGAVKACEREKSYRSGKCYVTRSE